MNIEQILQLSQAGFTAEQITALAPLISQPAQAAPAAAPAPAPAPAPATQEPAAQVPAQEAPAKQAPAKQEPAAPTMDDVMDMLKKMQSSMYANAIMGSQQPQVNTASAEDILATIVAPTKK